jgi:hypothetical protein
LLDGHIRNITYTEIDCLLEIPLNFSLKILIEVFITKAKNTELLLLLDKCAMMLKLVTTISRAIDRAMQAANKPSEITIREIRDHFN